MRRRRKHLPVEEEPTRGRLQRRGLLRPPYAPSGGPKPNAAAVAEAARALSRPAETQAS